MEWILICNNNYYDIKGAFSTYSTVTWPQVDGIVKGSTVYCYVTNPYRAVLFKCEVDETNLNHMDDAAKEYVKHALFYENKQSYMRLICKEKYPEDKFTDVILKENGLESLQLTSNVTPNLSKLFGSYKSKNQSKGKRKILPAVIGIAVVLTAGIFAGVQYNEMHKKNSLYLEAIQKKEAKQYAEAINVFEQLGEYKDSADQIKNCEELIQEDLYGQAVAFVDAGSFEEAIIIFDQLGTYKDSKEQALSCNSKLAEKKKEESYDNAIKLMQAGTYNEAVVELESILGYEDTETLLAECEAMKQWYPVYKKIADHTKYKGVECITHSKEERDALRTVLPNSGAVPSLTEFDPKDPGTMIGLMFWSSGAPDDFPVKLGDSKKVVFDNLGITDSMIESSEWGYFNLHSDELLGIGFSKYTSDNSFGGISFYRTDNTCIELGFASDTGKLDKIAFWDTTDHSQEIKEFEKQMSQGEDSAIDWAPGKSLKVGDIVKFGHYEQDGSDDDETEDISWYVVSSENNEYFLVSRIGLDIVNYDEDEEGYLTWSDSYLRKWLQNEFYSVAFDDEEKSVIVTKTLEVEDHLGSWFDEDDVAEVTEDKVFLLSEDEVDKYLNSTQRLMLVSDYVKGIAESSYLTTCGYYLRACYSGDTKLGWGVDGDGEVRPYDCDGPLSYSPPVAVRPAVWIKQ